MEPEQIATIIQTALPQAHATVSGAGGKFTAIVISDEFAEMDTLDRHRRVYAVLNEAIADGSIHALSIYAYTHAEYSVKKQSEN